MHTHYSGINEEQRIYESNTKPTFYKRNKNVGILWDIPCRSFTNCIETLPLDISLEEP
ncbi:hypothetical protein YC2023_086681 [Brassica napus]